MSHLNTEGSDEEHPEYNVASEYYVDYVRQSAAYCEGEMLCSDVVPHLVAGGYITDRQREDLEHEPRQYAKNRLLLQLLVKKGSQAVSCLFAALHEEGQSHVVSYIIKQGEARRRQATNPICTFRVVGCPHLGDDADSRQRHEEQNVLNHLHLLVEQMQEMKNRESVKDRLVSSLQCRMAQLEQELNRYKHDYSDFKCRTQEDIRTLHHNNNINNSNNSSISNNSRRSRDSRSDSRSSSGSRRSTDTRRNLSNDSSPIEDRAERDMTSVMRSCPDLSTTDVKQVVTSSATRKRLDHLEQRQTGLFKEVSSLNVDMAARMKQLGQEQEEVRRGQGSLRDDVAIVRVHIKDQIKQIHSELTQEQAKQEKERRYLLGVIPGEVSRQLEEIRSTGGLLDEEEIEALKTAIKDQSLEMFSVKEELELRIIAMETRVSILQELSGTDGVYTWRLANLHHIIKEVEADPCAGILESPPFFSDHHGYCFKLGLNLPMSVAGSVQGLHPWICLCSGRHDDRLSWPFRGQVEFGLVDVSGRGRHLLHRVDATSDGKQTHWHRPSSPSPSNNKMLYPTYILLTSVKHYLLNDTLYINVKFS